MCACDKHNKNTAFAEFTLLYECTNWQLQIKQLYKSSDTPHYVVNLTAVISAFVQCFCNKRGHLFHEQNISWWSPPLSSQLLYSYIMYKIHSQESTNKTADSKYGVLYSEYGVLLNPAYVGSSARAGLKQQHPFSNEGHIWVADSPYSKVNKPIIIKINRQHLPGAFSGWKKKI